MTPVAAALLLLALATPAFAHHVGAYTPRDNEVTTNFKEIKFSVQAKKFEVALRLFDQGALRTAMREKPATLPAGLERGTRAALQAGDAAEVERHLMIFFASLSRDLALEADRQLADATLARQARAKTADRFLEAIWRYYNLVDFAVASRDNKTSTALRLAFDEAEGYAKTTSASEADKLRGPLRRIAQLLSTLIDTSSALPRRDS
ncbi:MAG TPA: hypothetical protein VMR23_17915 [Candidatus Limnocylindria bacterium]|nr:hypothetical protein [Candidatus Limnocylindria bacterium]